jgi:hypothetical protein
MMEAGTYTLSSYLTVSRSGTASAPITIEGEGSSTGINGTGDYGIAPKSDYVHYRKFRLTNAGQQAMWFSGASYNVVDNMECDHTPTSCIHIHDASHHNVFQNSLFHDTGTQAPYWGEAIYVGNSGDSGFPLQTTNTDTQILNNHFGPGVGAQAVDVKQGSDRTVIRGNYIDGAGTCGGATNLSTCLNQGSASLIDVRANGVIIDGNTIRLGNPEGITFYGSASGGVVSNNHVDLQNVHGYSGWGPFGFALADNTPGKITIKCNNTVTNGPFSNVSCVP